MAGFVSFGRKASEIPYSSQANWNKIKNLGKNFELGKPLSRPHEVSARSWRGSDACGPRFRRLWPKIQTTVAPDSDDCGPRFRRLWPQIQTTVAPDSDDCGPRFRRPWPGPVRSILFKSAQCGYTPGAWLSGKISPLGHNARARTRCKTLDHEARSFISKLT